MRRGGILSAAGALPSTFPVGVAALLGGSAVNAADNTMKATAATDVTQQLTWSAATVVATDITAIVVTAHTTATATAMLPAHTMAAVMTAVMVMVMVMAGRAQPSASEVADTAAGS
jgi:hypothetical protein